MPARFSSSRSIRRVAAVGALILLASSLPCLNAETISGRGRLISPPFTAEIGDRVVVAISNFGRRAIQCQVVLLRATDFVAIETGVVQTLKSQTAFFSDSTLGAGFGNRIIAVIEYQSSGKSEVKTSFQLIDEDGHTQIFADGFESGNTSQ